MTLIGNGLKTKICMVAMSLFLLIPLLQVSASDMLVTNFDFEDGLNGWTYHNTSSATYVTLSAARYYSGAHSVKIDDTSATVQYGIESNKMAAAAGKKYLIFVKTYLDSGSANLYIRFYDSSGNLLNSAFEGLSSPQQEWTDLKVSAIAPANTAYVSALLYSNKGNVGVVYFDDVLITEQYTDLGTQVTNAAPQSATFALDTFDQNTTNTDRMYIGMQGTTGYDGRMAVVDLNSNNVTDVFDLEGSIGGISAATATNGVVYFGSSGNGHVYKHTPGTSTVTDLGAAVSGESHVWDLTAGPNAKIYGGTYPNAAFFRYYPGATDPGFMTLDQPVVSGEDYVRSVAYDAGNNVTYLGVGSQASLIRYDNGTGTKTSILPAQYSDQEYVKHMTFTGGKLFVTMTPSFKTAVLSISSSGVVTQEAEIEGIGSYGVSPAYNGKVYFTISNQLHSYDIATQTTASLVHDGLPNAVESGFVWLNDQTNYPGYTLVGAGLRHGQTWMYKYNIQNDDLSIIVLDIPEIPTGIESFLKGPDNRIYSSGYWSGGTGIYTPLRSDQSFIERGVGQTEGMAEWDGKMYFGVYPSAKLYEYDTSQPWDIDTTTPTNPVKLFDLSADEQSRPFGMTSGDGKIVMGTIPNSGKLGGAIAIYDTNTEALTVRRNLVQDQSITSVAYKDGKVYAGTSIFGGTGSTPTQTEAKLLIYDIATDTSTVKSFPVSKKAATGVTVGPDGNIWGFVEGYLFVYNPITDTFDYCQQKFASVDYSNVSRVWHGANLLVNSRGDFFGTIDNKYFFQIDPSTKNISNLASDGAKGLTEDEFGNLYYKYLTVLKRYAY